MFLRGLALSVRIPVNALTAVPQYVRFERRTSISKPLLPVQIVVQIARWPSP